MRHINYSYIINGVLAVAVIVLFILHFSDNRKNDESKPIFSEGSSKDNLPIAYVNTDSLMNNYKYAKIVREKLLDKVEASQANINQRQRSIQAQITAFQQKVNDNAFLNRESMIQEQERLGRLQQNLDDQAKRTSETLKQDQDKEIQALTNIIVSQLREYNKSKKYQVIFSNAGTDNILIADKAYNITGDVVKFLNNKYEKNK